MALADLIGAKADTATAESPEAPVELGVSSKPAPKGEPAESLGLEADETGQPRSVPWTAVAEQRAKRRAAEDRASQLEKELEAAKGKVSEVDPHFQKLYGQFEKPLDQMREDAEFAQAVWQLRDDPIVRQALGKIQAHHQGALKAVTDRDTKPEAKAAPAVDPMVQTLVAERLRDRTGALLQAARVIPELRETITDYVLAQKPEPTEKAVFSVVHEYVKSRGWTNEFLRGVEVKPKRAATVPNPGSQNAGAATPEKKETPQIPQVKTISGRERENRTRLHELMQQRGVTA